MESVTALRNHKRKHYTVLYLNGYVGQSDRVKDGTNIKCLERVLGRPAIVV